MKRLWSVLLVVCLTVSMMVGCGGQGAETKTETEATTTEESSIATTEVVNNSGEDYSISKQEFILNFSNALSGTTNELTDEERVEHDGDVYATYFIKDGVTTPKRMAIMLDEDSDNVIGVTIKGRGKYTAEAYASCFLMSMKNGFNAKYGDDIEKDLKISGFSGADPNEEWPSFAEYGNIKMEFSVEDEVQLFFAIINSDKNSESKLKKLEEFSREKLELPQGEEVKSIQTTDDKNGAIYSEGMYKIGADMPAGEYVLFATTSGYMQVSSDSTGSFESIISNENFDYNTIVSVNDGEYLTIKNGYAVPIDSNPDVKINGEGMFKVGVHIPAGEYKLTSTSNIDAYYQVTSDSSHSFDSIVANENFSGDVYVTVSDGQYLTINRAKIVQ